MTAWRSPLGGPRAAGRDEHTDDVDEWPEERIQAELEERRRAEAVAGPEPDREVRTDGGERTVTATLEFEPPLTKDELRERCLAIADHLEDE